MDRQSRRHERLQNRADAYSGLHLGASLRFEKSHRMAFPDKEQGLNLSYLFAATAMGQPCPPMQPELCKDFHLPEKG